LVVRQRIPQLKQTIVADIAAGEDKQSLIDALTTLQVVLPLLPSELHPHIEELVPGVVTAIKSSYAVVRNAAGKTLAIVCRSMPQQGMRIVLDELLPLLGDTRNLVHRQGAMEAIWGESPGTDRFAVLALTTMTRKLQQLRWMACNSTSCRMYCS